MDLVFVFWAATLVLFAAPIMLNSDGDLARHLRFGYNMLRSGRVTRIDTFSFTRTGEPFLAFEWGSEVVYAAVHQVGGLAGVAVFAALLIASSIALLVWFLRNAGVDPLLVVIAGVFAGLTASSHSAARPHLFTFLGAVLLWGMLERPGRRLPLLVAPLFVAWANLHGGFFWGLILIGIYLAGSAGEWLLGGREKCWRKRALRYAAALVVAALSALATPFRWKLYTHVFGFFSAQQYLTDNVIEFLSPDFHSGVGKVFLVTLLGLFGALLLARPRMSGPHLLVLLVATAFALISRRNIALWGLIAIPVAALRLDSAFRVLDLAPLRKLRMVVAFGDRASRVGRWTGALTLLLVLLGLNHGRVVTAQVVADAWDPAKFPVQAVAAAREGNLTGRLYSEYVWSGYLLYAWPEQKVFVDPGIDHYGNNLLRDYQHIRGLEPEWRDLLEAYGFTLALLPADFPLTHELVREPRWRVWYCDEQAVLLRRDDPATASPGGSTVGCPADLLDAAAAGEGR